MQRHNQESIACFSEPMSPKGEMERMKEEQPFMIIGTPRRVAAHVRARAI